MATRALHHALELAERPSLAGLMRKQNLPPDVITLIRIAAGSEEALAEEAALTGRSPRTIRPAAILYLQQVLLFPGADAYRILGATPQSSQEELGQHMRLLMKWLHPDRDRGDWESAFAERVSGAWDLVKSAERRARYDAAMQVRPAASARRKQRRRQLKGLHRLPSIERQQSGPGRSRAAKIVARSAAALVVAAVALALFAMPELTRPLLAPRGATDDGSVAHSSTGAR